MEIEETKIPPTTILVPKRFGDRRGFFSEIWNRRTMAQHGLDVDFVQDNHSVSEQVGTIRGLHFQTAPHAQAKLVRCGRGRLLDVVVDIRAGSPTYRQWIGRELSFENGCQMFVPVGFAHGFITLEPNTEIIYKCSDYYAPECEGTVRFDDPDIGVDWGTSVENAILSDKDLDAPCLKDIPPPFQYEDSAT